MTGPLVVLGVLSARRADSLNLPEFVGGHAWLEHWLEPVTVAGRPRAIGAGRRAASTATGVRADRAGGAHRDRRRWWPAGGPRWRQPIAAGPAQAPPDDGLLEACSSTSTTWTRSTTALIVQPLVGFSAGVLWKGVDQG